MQGGAQQSVMAAGTTLTSVPESTRKLPPERMSLIQRRGGHCEGGSRSGCCGGDDCAMEPEEAGVKVPRVRDQAGAGWWRDSGGDEAKPPMGCKGAVGRSNSHLWPAEACRWMNGTEAGPPVGCGWSGGGDRARPPGDYCSASEDDMWTTVGRPGGTGMSWLPMKH
ncbi:hypothetical protein E2C01_066811 [Portunus trituberculatus]|uniref:Uncharacterized protein n=1 Tax=Portunus trituberculatus TaxID=210409 RepID=A0A5B7HMJ1_PORTR|nr:hypothetical protein [Portunus trituberculatus]